ncbi:MAG: DUF3630 family protein [Aeromonas sp.]
MSWQIKQIDSEAGIVTLDCPALDWDSFPLLAQALLREWELGSLGQDVGADRHSWLLAFEGSQFRLEYDHYSGCWLAAVHPGDWEALLWLVKQHKD